MADRNRKRNLTQVTTDTHRGKIRKLGEVIVEGHASKTQKIFHNVLSQAEDILDRDELARISPSALLGKQHDAKSYQPQFLFLKPGHGQHLWIAVLLFRGVYWTAESLESRLDAKRKAAESAIEWLHSPRLHPRNTNARLLHEAASGLSAKNHKGSCFWEIELDWTTLMREAIPIQFPQWTDTTEPFLAFFGEPTKKDATSAKIDKTEILLPAYTWFFPYRPAAQKIESQKATSSTQHTSLPVYLRVSSAFRYHKKRAACSESKSSVADTSPSTAHQSSTPASDAQAPNVYTPCPTNMQLVKYTPRPRLEILCRLWRAIQIPTSVAQILNVYTPCPPDKQLVIYTPMMSLEVICGGRQTPIESTNVAAAPQTRGESASTTSSPGSQAGSPTTASPPTSETVEVSAVQNDTADTTHSVEVTGQEASTVEDGLSNTTPAGMSPQEDTTSVDDGTTYGQAMDTEQSLTTYVEATYAGGENANVEQHDQHTFQQPADPSSTLSEVSDMEVDDVTDMHVDESEPEFDNDIEMEEDDGSDPTSESFIHTPGAWASMIGTSSAPETSMADELSQEEEDPSESESDDSDLDMDTENPADAEDSSSATNVTGGSEDIEDGGSDTVSEPPSDFEDDNPFEEKGEEGGEGSNDVGTAESPQPTQNTMAASDEDVISSQFESFSLGADSASPPSTTPTAAATPDSSAATESRRPSTNTDTEISTDFSNARRHSGAESESESGDESESDDETVERPTVTDREGSDAGGEISREISGEESEDDEDGSDSGSDSDSSSESEDDREDGKKMTDEEIDELAEGGLSGLRV